MFKKVFIFLTLVGLSINCGFAGDLILKVSPVNELTSCSKYIFEGDEVKFKIIEDNYGYKKGEMLTGTILKYKPNGFNGEEANISIGNFRKENGDAVNGELYLSGNTHKVYQEYANGHNSDLLTIPLIRGGEIKLKPNEAVSFLTSNKKQLLPAIKIRATNLISTCHDEIQINDSIRFITIKDVYVNNKIYIKKDSPIVGYVDSIEDNGWNYDNALINIKKFKTRDVNGNIVEINSNLTIDGFEILKYKSNRPAQFFNYIGVYFRGKEIEIIPEKDKDINFNIWLTK